MGTLTVCAPFIWGVSFFRRRTPGPAQFFIATSGFELSLEWGISLPFSSNRLLKSDAGSAAVFVDEVEACGLQGLLHSLDGIL